MRIARGGFVLVAVATAAAFAAFVAAAVMDSRLVWVLAYAAVILALLIAFLFRDPERAGERGPHLILSPADGRVTQVQDVEEPAFLRGPAKRISIYLGILDVHVQRSPVAGTIGYLRHVPGQLRRGPAARSGSESDPRAPEAGLAADAATGEPALEDEHAWIGIQAGPFRTLIRQGAQGRQRVVTYVHEGERVEQGDRIGMIRFGSRVDAFLPPATALKVSTGQRVYAGRTVLGELPRGTP